MVSALVLKAEIKYPIVDNNVFVVTGEEIINQKEYISKFDLSGMLEVAIEGNLSEHIVLCPTLTYKHSLTTIYNRDYLDDNNMRHYGFSVSVGLKYILNE